MSAKKVIEAYKLAKLSEEIPSLVFTVDSGSSFYVLFKGIRILEVDRAKEANAIVDALNGAVSHVLSTIRQEYNQRIDEILNA